MHAEALAFRVVWQPSSISTHSVKSLVKTATVAERVSKSAAVSLLKLSIHLAADNRDSTAGKKNVFDAGFSHQVRNKKGRTVLFLTACPDSIADHNWMNTFWC